MIARSVVAMDNNRIVGDENSGTTCVPLIVTCNVEANVQVKRMSVCVAFLVVLKTVTLIPMRRDTAPQMSPCQPKKGQEFS